MRDPHALGNSVASVLCDPRIGMPHTRRAETLEDSTSPSNSLSVLLHLALDRPPSAVVYSTSVVPSAAIMASPRTYRLGRASLRHTSSPRQHQKLARDPPRLPPPRRRAPSSPAAAARRRTTAAVCRRRQQLEPAPGWLAVRL